MNEESSLTLSNTLGRKKEKFIPQNPNHIGMYVCGITPYEDSHIGHARCYVTWDILYRLLRYTYGINSVTYVRNVTDVDDKIIAKAAALGTTPNHVATACLNSFHADMQILGCLPPTQEPKVTEYIPQIVAYIEKLVAQGCAYVLDDGVYLDIARIPEITEGRRYLYGQLSGKKIDDLKAGARVDVKEGKRNTGDFALWKHAKPEEPAEIRYKSPWGEGRPGWHIECSVMGEALLGKTFDIHAGGEDLQFPHHENELAQCVCANKHVHATYWLHNAFVTVDGKKMSKSLNNFTTIKDVLSRFQDANKKIDTHMVGAALRFWLLQTHYRKPVDYSDTTIKASISGVYKMLNRVSLALTGSTTAEVNAKPREEVAMKLNQSFNAILAALSYDLNTVKALGKLNEMVNYYKSAEVTKGLRTAEVDVFKTHIEHVSGLLGLDLNLLSSYKKPTN